MSSGTEKLHELIKYFATPARTFQPKNIERVGDLDPKLPRTLQTEDLNARCCCVYTCIIKLITINSCLSAIVRLFKHACNYHFTLKWSL